jgi:hypothetical protein
MQRCRGSIPGVKRLDREVDQSFQLSDKVKNEWSYTSTSPIRLLAVGRDSFMASLEAAFNS